MKITKQEKERLIHRFKMQVEQRREALESELREKSVAQKSRTQRRKLLIPRMFTSLKIKEVLDVESERKVKIYELIADINKRRAQKREVAYELESGVGRAERKEDKEHQRKMKRLDEVKRRRKESLIDRKI